MVGEQSILQDNIQNKVQIRSFINKPVPSVCYIIYRNKFSDCVIVDPGNRNIIEIKRFIYSKRLTLKYIILTHEHFDHVGGVEPLRELYSCKLISSEECSVNITDAKRNFSLFHDQIGFSCKPAEIIINERFKLRLWSNIDLFIFPTPGHSEGSICVSFENILITGDTLLNNLKTVIKLPGGNKGKLIESLQFIQKQFNGSTKIYPGHGKPFFLSQVDFNKVV